MNKQRYSSQLWRLDIQIFLKKRIHHRDDESFHFIEFYQVNYF